MIGSWKRTLFILFLNVNTVHVQAGGRVWASEWWITGPPCPASCVILNGNSFSSRRRMFNQRHHQPPLMEAVFHRPFPPRSFLCCVSTLGILFGWHLSIYRRCHFVVLTFTSSSHSLHCASEPILFTCPLPWAEELALGILLLPLLWSCWFQDMPAHSSVSRAPRGLDLNPPHLGCWVQDAHVGHCFHSCRIYPEIVGCRDFILLFIRSTWSLLTPNTFRSKKWSVMHLFYCFFCYQKEPETNLLLSN